MKSLFFLLLFVFSHNSYGQGLKNFKFPNDYRGVIHLHSELSHDSNGKFEDIVKAAENNNIDFVIMTDHWSPTLYQKSKHEIFGNTLFIAGAEISKNDGITLLAVPLPENFVPENDWQKNVESLRKNGSFALASHIEFSETAKLVGVDGIEMTNLHSILVDRSYFGFVWMWIRALCSSNWNLAYLFNEKTVENLPRWHYLNQTWPLPAFAGNDTHDNYRLFYKLGPKLGSYDNTFKLITTHVWAKELEEKSITEAIKNGKSYFAFEIFGNSKGFRFYGTNGKDVFFPGDSASAKEKTVIALQSPPHKDPENTKLKILRDGKVVKEGTGILLNLETKDSGNYYGEIWKNEKPWIFSNPIKIK